MWPQGKYVHQTEDTLCHYFRERNPWLHFTVSKGVSCTESDSWVRILLVSDCSVLDCWNCHMNNKSEAYFFLVVVLGLELRVSSLLGRHSATWVMPLTLFALVIFHIGYCIFLPRTCFRLGPLTYGLCNITHSLLFEMGVSLTFFSGWPQTVILLVPASWVAGIIGMSHRAQQRETFYSGMTANNHRRTGEFRK
jgi:hypothetical protein